MEPEFLFWFALTIKMVVTALFVTLATVIAERLGPMRGTVEIYSGNPLAAIPFLERAIRLDPVYTQQYIHFLGSAFLIAGNYEEAATSLRERIRLAPETDLSRALLVSSLGHLGEIGEAKLVWADLKRVNPKYSFAGHLARLPFSNPADADRIKDGIAKAGLLD